MSRRENGSVVVAATFTLTDIDRSGKLCIEVKPTDKIAFISEFLCIGCGICVKKCVRSRAFLFVELKSALQMPV
jgi:translation initiation factor RLI1